MKTRVEPVATVVGAHTFQPRSKDPDRWMPNQKRWIREQEKSGRKIFDIGPDPNRPNPSSYYAAEQERMRKSGRTKEDRGTITTDVDGTPTTFPISEWV